MPFTSFRTLLVLTVCLVEIGCSKGITRSTAATVLFVRGDVVFGQAERNRFQPVTPGSKIRDGDVVRTSDGAAINLVLVPGAFVRVSENSEIKIEALSLTKDGNETAGGVLDRRARVRLSRGRVSVLFSRSDPSGSHCTLATKQMIISSDSDCLFSVWTDGSITRVTCARGELRGASDGQTPVRITTGYFHQCQQRTKQQLPHAAENARQWTAWCTCEAKRR